MLTYHRYSMGKDILRNKLSSQGQLRAVVANLLDLRDHRLVTAGSEHSTCLLVYSM